MNREQIISYLYNALQPDANLRQKAENGIMELQSTDYPFFVENMVDIFRHKQSEMQLKLISGIILKNSLHSKDASIQNHYEEKWCSIDPLRREDLKSKIIASFSNPDDKISLLAGSALGHIARIELPRGMYKDYFAAIEMYLLDASKIPSVYESLGLTCKFLISETTYSFDSVANSIFNICMQTLINKSAAPKVKEALLKCLMNAFEGLETVFVNENNVRLFMGGIAETAAINSELSKKSLICLIRFIQLFHVKIKTKLEDIVNYINNFWRIADEDTKIQLLEFWTVLSEAGYADIVNKNLNLTLSEVFKALEKGEDYNEQSWNSHKAATACLEALAIVYNGNLLKDNNVYSFINNGIMSKDPKINDIAFVALRCVITKDSEPIVVKMINVLINKMRDPVTEESSLWALARICETNFYAVVEHLPNLISQNCDIILSGYQTATSASWILSCIFKSLQAYKTTNLTSLNIPIETQKQLIAFAYSQINQHFTYILQVLIKATENVKLEDSTLRVALFSALSELVYSTDDANRAILDEFIVYCTQKINECVVAVERASPNYIPIIEDVLSNYVILSEVISKQRKKDSCKILLESYVSILKSKPTSAIGEVYIAISHNVGDFCLYLERLLPFISRDLTCIDEFILKSCINLIGCCASHMQTKFLQPSTHLIPLLINALSSKDIPKKLKPSILSVLGDIALSLGQYFEQYIEVSLMLYEQIVSLDRNGDEKYIDDLKSNIIIMMDCICMATPESLKLGNYMYRIVEGLKILTKASNSIATKCSTINLLADLNSIYGPNYDLNGKWIEDFLYECLYSNDEKLKQAANLAFQRFKFE